VSQTITCVGPPYLNNHKCGGDLVTTGIYHIADSGQRIRGHLDQLNVDLQLFRRRTSMMTQGPRSELPASSFKLIKAADALVILETGSDPAINSWPGAF